MSTDSRLLFDHEAAGLSELDLRMVAAIPPGGNWSNIPISIPSRRLEQIRKMAADRGGAVRTTYYGRLRPDRPAYTISTYFSRPGNGCNIHYEQDRTLSTREAARLQSFQDDLRFHGSGASKRRQVGNAVPPLLAMAVGSCFPPGGAVDLFCGAGGFGLGLEMAGHEVTVAVDIDSDSLATHAQLQTADLIRGDLSKAEILDAVVARAAGTELLVGGPPCQGWSFAGHHDQHDPRNGLVWTFIEAVQRMKPRAFLMENVEGLRWMAKGLALEEIKKAFRGLGYEVNHYVLNAAWYGVPQRRKRLFIVGTGKGTLPPRFPPNPRFGEDDTFLPPFISVTDAIGDLPSLSPGTSESSWEPPPAMSAYQRWCRSEITVEEMLAAYETKSSLGEPLEVTR